MKMETVIRSPQDGVIKKLAHKEGVSWRYILYSYEKIYADQQNRINAKLVRFWWSLKMKECQPSRTETVYDTRSNSEPLDQRGLSAIIN